MACIRGASTRRHGQLVLLNFRLIETALAHVNNFLRNDESRGPGKLRPSRYLLVQSQ